MSLDPDDGVADPSEHPKETVALLQDLSEAHPREARELFAWMGAALVKDRHARLSEGGFSEEQRVPLAQVFIDLVAFSDGLGGVEPEPNSPQEPLMNGMVARWLRMAPSRPPLRDRPDDSAQTAEKGPNARARQQASPHGVLVGGPGRGKSTLVQYLSQLHRAALLDAHRGSLAPGAVQALDQLLDLSGKQGLQRPTVPCLPIFVPLSRFAAWLAAEPREGRTIERFLAHDAQETLRISVSEATFHLALERLPWLLALDGLDEVPGAEDRQRALESVDDFLAAHKRDRCVVIATTRPQSYAGELGWLPTYTLSAMSQARALTYARHLLAGRYWDDQDRQRQIEQRLLHASREPATARLMQTPLQVTILTALLAESARAPVERWRLFREFYNVVVRRESDRNERVASVLAKLRIHLDVVHERVGLLLQVEQERAGGSDASIDEAYFIEIVVQRLTEVGYSRADAARHAGELARIASERLVFLTGVRAGRVGFELRSFQEFFAAEALFNGRDSTMMERARHIARSSAWTNVLLFMASRSVATSSSLQGDLTLELCTFLEDPARDNTAAAVRAGARFALELLDEGALAVMPDLLVKTTERALRLLELPPSKVLQRLAATVARLCLDPETKEHVEPRVVQRLTRVLREGRPAAEQSTWIVALLLADEGVDAAATLVKEAWPTEVKDEADLLAGLTWISELSSRAIGERLPELVPRHPRDYWDSHTPHATWCKPWVDAPRRRLRPKFLGIHNVDLGIVELQRRGELVVDAASQTSPYWRVAAAIARFEREPSREALAGALVVFAELGTPGLRERLIQDGGLSWVVDACLRWANQPDRCRALVERARAGDLGDEGAWRAAEARWKASGITEDDLHDFVEHDGLPHPAIGDRGAAFGSLTFWGERGDLTFALMTLLALHRRANDGAVRSFLVDLVLESAGGVYADNRSLATPLAPDELAQLGERVDDSISINAVLALVQAGGDAAVEAALRWLNARKRYSMHPVSLRAAPIADLLIRAVRASPDARDLLQMLAFLPVAEKERMEPVPEDITAPQAGDSELVEACRLALEAHRGGFSVERAAAMGARIADLSSDRLLAAHLLMRAWTHRKPPLSEPERVLLGAVLEGGRAFAGLTSARVRALTLLEEHQATLSTSLSAPETWEALQLPRPAPARPTPPGAVDASPGSSPPELPVHFREIEIHGLRCYAKAELTDLHHEPDHGQWIVLLGENGMGKTTLLRAMAMTLLGSEVGALALGSSEAPYRRTGERKATIDVRTPQGSVLTSEIEGENGSERFVPSSPEGERPFVVAYGCRRGSALGGPDRAADFARLAAVRTLFDDPTSGLVPGEHWLLNLHRDAELESPPAGARRLLDDVLDVVARLLPDLERPTFDKDHVWVQGPSTGFLPVRLNALSDGYLTSLGWVMDMIARWIKSRRDAGKKVPDRFYEKMTGVVLLDELDLHLHPRWQVRVVSDLKKLFPRMTFVVTTHNPMTLIGAHKREIWVLGRDSTGATTVGRHDTDPRLRTGSELYSRFFGLSELYPHDLGEALRRYGFLASSPYRSDGEEREVHELHKHLMREGIDPGFPPMAREGS